MCHDQMGLRVYRGLGVVANKTASLGAGRHGTGVWIGQGYLTVRGLLQRPVHVLQTLDLLPDAVGAVRQVGYLLSPAYALAWPWGVMLIRFRAVDWTGDRVAVA